LSAKYEADVEKITALIAQKTAEYAEARDRCETNIKKFERRREEVQQDVESAEGRIRLAQKIDQEIDQKADVLAKTVEKAKVDKYIASKLGL
jgi:predicted nuclease with TOPRIM domain